MSDRSTAARVPDIAYPTRPVRAPTLRPQPAPFNIAEVQRDIEETLRGSEDLPARNEAEFAPKPPLPEYVQHAPNVSQLGRMTAEAVIKEWEAASKAIEEMGEQLTASAKKLEAALADVDDVMKALAETAQEHRERGKRIFQEVEAHSMLTDEVRSTCKAMREKLATS